MITFTQYLIEKIEMKEPEKAFVGSYDEGNIISNWTTSKGNKIQLSFDQDHNGVYDVSFTVNGQTSEDVTRSPDREILQTILHQMKKIVDENDITEFSFEAWSDSMDDKNITKLVKPYYLQFKELYNKHKTDYAVSSPLDTILRNIPNLNRIGYTNSTLKQINTLLSYTDLDNDLRNLLEKFKIIISRIDDMVYDITHTSGPNRRMMIYKRFLSQYLGPEWKISHKGNDGIVAKKLR